MTAFAHGLGEPTGRDAKSAGRSHFDATVLEGFVRSVLSRGFDQAVETPDCHREWWALCCGRDRFVAIAAPRGFAKSTAITHCYVLGATLFRDRKFVVIVSDTESQAIMFLQDIKRELQQNETIKSLFKLKYDEKNDVALFKDSETDIIVEFEDGYQFRIVARGAGQRVRGLKWGSRRPDLIVCDDLENDEIVLNKERRAKFKQWFYGALLPIRSDRGIIRVVGTILHMDSLLENLMPSKQLSAHRQAKKLLSTSLKEWTEVRLPWKSVKYRAHSADWKDYLWIEKKDEEELRRIRADYISQGLPEIYAQEYLNVPLDETFAYFRKGDFLPLTEADLKKTVHYYITADLAISEDERADYSAFVVGALDEDRTLQIRNVIRERMDGREIVDTILALQHRYQPLGFGIERGQIDKAIRPFLMEEAIRLERIPSLVTLSPSTDKESRAKPIQARMRARTVRFDKDADWYQDLEDECVRFPRDKHDDQVDALAYQGHLLMKMASAPTLTDMVEEEREEEIRKAGLSFEGRNPWTGY